MNKIDKSFISLRGDQIVSSSDMEYKWPRENLLPYSKIRVRFNEEKFLHKIEILKITEMIGSLLYSVQNETSILIFRCVVYSEKNEIFVKLIPQAWRDERICAGVISGACLFDHLYHVQDSGPFFLFVHIDGFFWIKRELLD